MTKDPNSQEAHRQIIGDPVTVAMGLRSVEVAIYELDGYGKRVIAVDRTTSGALKPSGRTNCIHGKPINGNPFDIKHGDLAAYARICTLCTYEAEHL